MNGTGGPAQGHPLPDKARPLRTPAPALRLPPRVPGLIPRPAPPLSLSRRPRTSAHLGSSRSPSSCSPPRSGRHEPMAAPLGTADDTATTLLLFHGEGCPHCAAERAWLEELSLTYPQLRIEQYEVWNDQGNRDLLDRYATDLGFEPAGVPVTIVGDQVWIGFSEPIAAEIEASVVAALAVDPPTRRDLGSTLGDRATTARRAHRQHRAERRAAPRGHCGPWEARPCSSARCSSGSPMASTRARCGSWRYCSRSSCTAGLADTSQWSARHSCS